MTPEEMLLLYLKAQQMRRELAEIMKDEKTWAAAREAEQDAATAVAMVRAGVW